MAETYTKSKIAQLLSCSVSTIEKDAAYFNINPAKGDRGANLYSEKDFNLISQMRSHCANKSNTRDSFAPSITVEIMDDEPKVSKIVKKKSDTLSTNKFTKSLEIALQHDPLFDLELLQRIANNKWMLPAKRLAPLINLSPKYLNSLQKYYYCSFICIKEVYAGGQALWKVESNNS